MIAIPSTSSSRGRRPSAGLAAAALLLVTVPAAASWRGNATTPNALPRAAPSGGSAACGVGTSLPDLASPAHPEDGTPLVDPKRVEMTPTARARGARGAMELRMGASPYGVAVDPEGSYRLRVEVTVEGLRSRDGVHHVVWAATPDLDRHVRLGTLGRDGRAGGELSWNKFLVFVTAEATPEPESWSQEILLSALSPSGRMHTMAGHGPFSGEPCLDPRS